MLFVLRAANPLQQRGADQRAGQIGLQNEPPAKCFHHHQHFFGSSPETTILLIESEG
ncbi:hypothetical protein D3C80_2053670 [compost metagenome]